MHRHRSLSLLFSIIAGMFAPLGNAVAQPPVQPRLLADALAFRAPAGEERARVDVYVSMPYEHLQFEKTQGKYAAKYTVHVSIRDSVSRKSLDTSFSRTVIEDEYTVARGATGRTDNSVTKMLLMPGSYKMEVTASDQFSRREAAVSRQIVVPDLVNELPGMSSIMLVSEIEQREQRFRITPFISDVVWNTEQPLFAFMELYTETPPAVYALSWTILAADGKSLGKGIGQPVPCPGRATQTFVRLALANPRALPGTYTLHVHMHPVRDAVTDTTDTLASRTRPYVVPRSTMGNVMSDLNKAIKQLIYIAEQKDIDMITSAVTESEKQQHFEEYWKKQDPTPNTVRNEAFEDYYARIERANKNYKSYSEGWLTDMGRVSIIYGEPVTTDRYTSNSGASQLVRWNYASGQYFIFEDATGFGDFRLRTALSPSAKYTYRR